jgi:preprotein translocase subunit SecE
VKIRNYIRDSYHELMHKVTWPTWSELQGSAIVVLIASLLIALVVFIMDSAFSKGMKFLYDTLF